MKDTSKAQWPDGMTTETIPDRDVIFIVGELYVGELYVEEGLAIAKARAAQICALPEMVAWIKEAITDSTLPAGSQERYDQADQLYRRGKALLKQIGEIE